MPIDDLLQSLPVGEIGPEELGVPSLPPPPAHPPIVQAAPQKEQWMHGLALAMAAALGPQRGAGLPSGILQSQRESQFRRDQDSHRLQQEYQQHQQAYDLMGRAHDAELQKKQQGYASAVTQLRNASKGVTKDQYEELLKGFTGSLQSLGYRVDPNRLRRDAPYLDPGAEGRAKAAIDRWMKNPVNEKLLKDDPQRAVLAVLPVDVDGDGVPEQRLPLKDLAALAGMPFAEGPDGKPMFSDPGTTLEDKAGVDARYRDLLDIARAEGKDVDSKSASAAKLRNQIRDQAMTDAAQAVPKPPKEPKEPNPNQTFSMEERLAKTWSEATKAQREMQRQFSIMQTGLRRFKQGDTNGGSQAVLVTFQKILDPNSVVRESEYARTAAGQSMMSRLEGYVERLAQGGAGMTVAELSAMVETARQFVADMQNFHAGLRRRLTTQIGNYKLNPAGVFDDVLTGATPEIQPAESTDMPAVDADAILKARQQRGTGPR